jgi:hypothetical protein
LPGFLPFFLEDHIGFDPQLSEVFSKMIGIFQYEFHWSFFPEASDSEVEPIFGGGVEADVGIPLDFDGERGKGNYAGGSYVPAWETAVNYNG